MIYLLLVGEKSFTDGIFSVYMSVYMYVCIDCCTHDNTETKRGRNFVQVLNCLYLYFGFLSVKLKVQKCRKYYYLNDFINILEHCDQ